MVKTKLDIDDAIWVTKRLKKTSKNTLIFSAITFILILILFEGTKNQTQIFYFIFNTLVFSLWMLNCLVSTYAVLSLGRKIKNNKVFKIEDEFIVVSQDYYTGIDSDEFGHHLRLKSTTNKKIKLSVSEQDYDRIEIKNKITLIYLEELNIVLEAKFNNKKLSIHLYLFHVLNLFTHLIYHGFQVKPDACQPQRLRL